MQRSKNHAKNLVKILDEVIFKSNKFKMYADSHQFTSHVFSQGYACKLNPGIDEGGGGGGGGGGGVQYVYI